MEFDQESESEDFFFFGRGGGWVWGVGKIPTKKINNRCLLIFCAHAVYKIVSSWLKWFSSFNTNKTCHRDMIARLISPCPSHKKRKDFEILLTPTPPPT